MALRSVAARGCAALTAAMVALAGGSVVLTACSGGSDAVDTNAGGQFRYVGATARGKVIAVDKRKPAGNVRAELLDGQPYTLASQRGKVVVLNFWATWCPPCVVESPQFDKIYRSMKAMGVEFVGLTVKDPSKSAIRAFVADNDISYPIVYDETAKTALQLGKLPLAAALPDSVVIDKQGRVAAVYVGPLARGDLQPVLTTLANET